MGRLAIPMRINTRRLTVIFAKVYRKLMKRLILVLLVLLTACSNAPSNNQTPIPNAGIAIAGVPFKDIPQTIDKDGFYTLGDPSARLVMTDYADFLCTNCRIHFETTEPELIEKYVRTGKIRLSVRYVLDFGEHSLRTAEASACASLQGYGWQMHDLLFQNQAEVWNTAEDRMIPLMKKYAMILKELDQPKFGTCIETRQMQKIIEAEDAERRTRGITTRPSFEINGLRLIGNQPIEAFASFIDNTAATAQPDRQGATLVP